MRTIVETLEARALLSATVIAGTGVSYELTPGGVLHVTGDDTQNIVRFEDQGSNNILLWAGEANDPVAFIGITKIIANLGDGGDQWLGQALSIPQTVDGGKGDDIIRGGKADDLLIGGNGNDQLFGDSGDDILIGNNGDDYLDGGDGADKCNGGGGTDTVVG